MPGQLFLPPQVEIFTGPLVFLAGPIQGAPDWHSEAIRLLQSLAPDLNVASPRRRYPPGEFDYGAQVDWESHHLRLAGRTGAILFWLAREVEHSCTRAYAQTTRFELAEWKVKHERDGVKLVVGIEDGFTGARYIRRRLEQDCPGVPIASTLPDACRVVVELAIR